MLALGAMGPAAVAAEPPVATVPEEAALPPPRPGAHVVADAGTLILQADSQHGPKTLADLGREEAEVIRAINAKRGTYQSYLLYTAPEHGSVRLFHPGFTITLPPPRQRVIEAAREGKGTDGTQAPAGPAPR